MFGCDSLRRITNTCEVYDYESNTWASIKPMHSVRTKSGAAEYDGDIYVFFGEEYDHKEQRNYKFLNNAERYSIQEDEWTSIEFESNHNSPPEVQIQYRFLGIHNDVCYCLLIEGERNSFIYKRNIYMKTCIKGFDMKSYKEKLSKDVTNLFKLYANIDISTIMHDGTIYFQNRECFIHFHVDSYISKTFPFLDYKTGQFLIFLMVNY